MLHKVLVQGDDRVVEAVKSSDPKTARRKFAKSRKPQSQPSTAKPTASSASSHNPQIISSPPDMSAARAFSTALRAGAPRAPIARFAATRGYAAAASAQNSKPPVALFGVDGTYASALVRFSRDQLAEK